MSWRTVTLLVVGTVLVLLGGLWLLQGTDAIQVRPILCVTNCKPVTGGSIGWLTAGVVTLLIGLVVFVGGLRLRRRPR